MVFNEIQGVIGFEESEIIDDDDCYYCGFCLMHLWVNGACYD